ncbi:MAG: hypothetical protein EHM72_01480 [Calditrichaeota bacterium]|nr:MAG: hypothetical protein EHM72_01480 [Calditrichota bacterium]
MHKRKIKDLTQKTPSPHRLSPAKRRLFTAVLLLVPIIFLSLTEIILRLNHYGGEDRLFLSIPDAQSPYYGINTEIGKRYFSRLDFSPTPRKDLFLKEKPANGYRIFVLGGSSAAGFPYGNNITFPRILHRRLQETFPDKKIEVVNMAMTAICSYTLLDFMDEILQCKPDLLLIYAGHNEFYGALGVASVESLGRMRGLVLASLKLRHLKLYLLMRDVIRSIKGMRAASHPSPADPFQTVMARIAENPEIPLGSRRYQQGLRQFEKNMDALMRKAAKAKVPVVLSELVSNVRDQQPFISLPAKGSPSAADVYRQAQDKERMGEYESARRLYLQAKDLDALRFRAPEDFNRILHRLSERHAAPLVPMQSIFEQVSPNHIIGQGLMTEHLHPNIDGYFIMADAFYRLLRDRRMIKADWKLVRPMQDYRRHWGYTQLDSVYAALTIAHLKSGWPFHPADQPNRFFELFQPKSREEAVVKNILLTGSQTLEQGHLELAAFYEQKGEFEKAYREYLALTFIVPYLDLFYQPMIELLMKQQEYSLALSVLYDALKYQDSAFVYKWIGQIYLVTGETRRGLRVLEEALKRDPHDAQAMYNTCRGYFNLGDIAHGDPWFLKFKSLVPNAPEIVELEQLRLQILNRPRNQ